MRNLERAAPVEVADKTKEGLRRREREFVEDKMDQRVCESGVFEELEKIRPRVFEDLSPEALNYIEKLQAELSDMEAVRILGFIHVCFQKMVIELYISTSKDWKVAEFENFFSFK